MVEVNWTLEQHLMCKKIKQLIFQIGHWGLDLESQTQMDFEAAWLLKQGLAVGIEKGKHQTFSFLNHCA